MRNFLNYILLLLCAGGFSLIAQPPKDTLAYVALERKIDSIITDAIAQRAFPGCVIYASQAEEVVFSKAYGHHTYDSIQPIVQGSIYDLASITKMLGATFCLMKLYEDSLLHLDEPIKNYVTRLKGRLGKVTLREALSHQGGLYPWVPFYQQIKKKKGHFKRRFISKTPSSSFAYKMADDLYLHNHFYTYIKRRIRKSPVQKNPGYAYSGLFFYLVPEIIQNLTGTDYETFLIENFLKPLGTETITFNPLQKLPLSRIVPTEVDTFFRMTPIRGKVHDEGAIMMKGVSGNAGLFGNAEEVSEMMGLLLNHGRKDTIQLLKPSTIDLFTTAQYPNLQNRRGLGFDKPLLVYDADRSSVAEAASHKSFGHTGYTGTLAWADPEKELVFTFLSNRVYPSRKNRMIYKLNVRPTIHQLIYDHLERSERGQGQPVRTVK